MRLDYVGCLTYTWGMNNEVVEAGGVRVKKWAPSSEEDMSRSFDWYDLRLQGKTNRVIARDTGYTDVHVSRCINWAAGRVAEAGMGYKESSQFYEDKAVSHMARLEALLDKMETEEGVYSLNERIKVVKEIRAHIKLASELKGVKKPDGSGGGNGTINVIMPNLTQAKPQGVVIDADTHEELN